VVTGVAGGSVDSTRARILVIDDSIDILEFLQLALESAGYDVKVASDGLDGLEAVRTFKPQLIITDISMPRMNGFDFLVRLRSDFTPPLPPVVVCSGFDVTAEEALRLGAVRFMAKPIEAAALLTAAEQALRGEVADAASLARERGFMRATRARAAAAAARLLAGSDLQAPELVRPFTRAVQWISDYFGYTEAGLTFVQGEGDILVAAVSRGSAVQAGMTLSGRALYSTGALGAGSSLVLGDASSLASFGDPRVAALGVRFVVAVPLLFQDVAVGALVLMDQRPHSFEAEDLLILERIGRYLAGGLPDTLQRIRERTLTGQNVGLVPPAVFESMLAAELALLHRERGWLDLLLVEIDATSLDPDWAIHLAGGRRFGLCRRDAGTLALFKRGSTSTAASAVSDVLTALRTVVTVRAVGWVSVVDNGLSRVPDQLLLQLAGMALEEARLSPAHPVERIVIRRENPGTDHFVRD
jgi:CheY-like chemotaxis protein